MAETIRSSPPPVVARRRIAFKVGENLFSRRQRLSDFSVGFATGLLVRIEAFACIRVWTTAASSKYLSIADSSLPACGSCSLGLLLGFEL